MSVESTRTAPQVETVLTIWQDTLNEATLTVDQALSAAAMMLGFVVMNTMPTQPLSHSILSDLVQDIHGFVDANWEQAATLRKQVGKAPLRYDRPEEPRLPGTSVSELKRLIDQAGTIDPANPPDGVIQYPDIGGQYGLTLSYNELQMLEQILEEAPYKLASPLMELIRQQVGPA